ncbi:MAG: efflux transporter outer membrane subunit [Formosimonas sp.]
MLFNRHYIPLALALSLTACTVGPTYHAPTSANAPQWYAALPHNGQNVELLNWWQSFNDVPLLELQKSAEANNPNLAQSLARIDAARAQAGISSASAWPSVNGSASQTRNNGSDGGNEIRRNRLGVLDASWEIDLWGGQRAGRAAADAQLSARTLDWHAARTSIAAEVASTYVAYRACMAQTNALQQDLTSREETARLTGLLVNVGFSAPAEGYLTDASAATARQSLVATRAECDLNVKALVTLTGLAEPAVRELLSQANGQPNAPTFELNALPVVVISQRPDVAAAERTLAAASAQINVAQANRLPRLALLGNISFFGIKLSGSDTSSNGKTWSFGPSLSVPLLDAGQRAAQADVAKADYAQALAAYRASVAQAVQEVESALVQVTAAQKRLSDAHVAQKQFERFFNATAARQREGSASLLELEEARRNQLSATQNLINLKREYTSHWIALYKAVGGSWHLVNPNEKPHETQ